jgi:hypothetical protein
MGGSRPAASWRRWATKSGKGSGYRSSVAKGFLHVGAQVLTAEAGLGAGL